MQGISLKNHHFSIKDDLSVRYVILPVVAVIVQLFGQSLNLSTSHGQFPILIHQRLYNQIEN